MVEPVIGRSNADDLDQTPEPGEVVGVAGVERQPVCMGGRGDEQVTPHFASRLAPVGCGEVDGRGRLEAMSNVAPRASDNKAMRRVSHALAEIGFALPGSVVVRDMRCGKASCRCRADPPELHGPYIQWTRRVEGRTVTRYLSPEQFERYRPWFDNARRLRELVAQLEALSLLAAEHAEGWASKA